MSRSNYTDDESYPGQFAMWRGQVNSAIRGRRGQSFLKDLLAALDAMPEKRLIKNDLVRGGEVCTIGALGRVRGIDMSKIDVEDPEQVAAAFGIAHQLASEIEYWNDENDYRWETDAAGKHQRIEETPEERWTRMRAYIASQIKEEKP